MDFKNELRHATQGVNIPPYERMVTAALGLAAIYLGTRHRGILGWALAAAGSGIAARGIGGHCPGYRKFMTGGEAENKDDVASRSPYQTSSGMNAGATTRPQM